MRRTRPTLQKTADAEFRLTTINSRRRCRLLARGALTSLATQKQSTKTTDLYRSVYSLLHPPQTCRPGRSEFGAGGLNASARSSVKRIRGKNIRHRLETIFPRIERSSRASRQHLPSTLSSSSPASHILLGFLSLFRFLWQASLLFDPALAVVGRRRSFTLP